LDHAREQFRRACALPIPDGFVRIVHELTGFEDDGSIGAIYLVLKDRWDADRAGTPWLHIWLQFLAQDRRRSR